MLDGVGCILERKPEQMHYESLLMNTVCRKARIYLNKHDPAVLMENVTNKVLELMTLCVPAAAGATTYQGFTCILNDLFFHVCSHICRITSSDLSANKLCLQGQLQCV